MFTKIYIKKVKLNLNLAASVAILISNPLQAAEINQETGNSGIQKNEIIYFADPTLPIERISVVGNRKKASEIPGSATYLGAEELEVFEYSDINRILRQVAGINIQEEDGFGLRPNIGIRGTGLERSERITLMEDGVLIAPAPYAAPAAYYFPTAGRMNSIEVRKGSSAIKFGPRTTGGAINLVSTPIPDQFGGAVKARGGSHGFGEAQASFGGSTDNFGFNLEGFHGQSSGFKKLDVDKDTGFNIDDFVGKLRINSDENADLYQSLEFKFGVTDQTSNETYLGVTDADFQSNPFGRYAASQNDQFNSTHYQYQLTHFIELSENIDVTTVGYYNSFTRDWFKLDDLDFSDGRGRIRPSAIFGDPSGPLNVAALSILKGDTDSLDDALQMRHNARKYYSFGIQNLTSFRFVMGEIKHSLEVGFRYHEDQEDRLQNREKFKMQNGLMVQKSVDPMGSQGNRIAKAKAFAAFIQDEIIFGDFRIIPGLRYENIDLTRNDYSTQDPTRTLGTTGTRTNSVDVFIPGFGISYYIEPELQVILGVHRGFSPPGPSNNNASSEKSTNFEFGFRYDEDQLFIEAIGFYNNYSNLLGTCSNATGCNGGDVGDQFNGGSVKVSGLEFSIRYIAELGGGWRMPFQANYTLTNAQFREDFDDGFWGDVTRGDKLPYIPSGQGQVMVGIEKGSWVLSLSGNHVTKTRATAGQEGILPADEIPARLVFDASINYHLSSDLRVFATVDNAFDKSFVVARRPYGARPGKPRSIFVGLEYTF